MSNMSQHKTQLCSVIDNDSARGGTMGIGKQHNDSNSDQR